MLGIGELKRNIKQNIRTHLVAIFFICFLVFLDFSSDAEYYEKNSVIVSIKEPKFSLLTPYNTPKSYPIYDDYSTLIDIKHFSFVINPQPCQNTSSLLLAIIISSKPTHFENRKVIRNTWGTITDSTKVFFLIGNSNNNTINDMIAQESLTHGDLIKGSFIDAYRNMTYKHVMGLKWIVHHCGTAKYILKADDDVVINIYKLRKFLVRTLSPWGAEELISCQVLTNAYPQRGNSKWKVSLEEYSKDYYPPYCSGWAVVYSQDVVSRLLRAVQLLDYFWIDDVHITGVAAEAIGVARTPFPRLVLENYAVLKNPRFRIKDKLMGPPNCNISIMEEMWKKYSMSQEVVQ